MRKTGRCLGTGISQGLDGTGLETVWPSFVNPASFLSAPRPPNRSPGLPPPTPPCHPIYTASLSTHRDEQAEGADGEKVAAAAEW